MNISVKILSWQLVFVLICLNVNLYEAHAQTGSPLLSHYRESAEAENQNWAICQDDNRVMMFANRRGILTFDGQNWGFIRLPVIPHAMKYKSDIKTVFIGSENNFGYLERDEKGFYNYYSLLSDSIDCGFITAIYHTDTTVWFYSETSLTRYNLNAGRIDLLLKAKEEKHFTGMFITPQNIFVNVYSEGLYRIESDTLFPLVTGYLLKDRDVLFSVPYDEKRVLIGIGGGKLLLFDGIKFYDYQVKDEGYLQQNYLSDGIVISDTLYAFSTLDGGVLVIEKTTGNIRHTINYARGLPDDEVYAMSMDNNGGLWISHQYGLTRADLVLPVANFTIYPGLKGNLFSSAVYNNELYVATSEGVFYLTEEKQYEKVEVMVREEPLQISPEEEAQQLSRTKMPQQQEPVVSET
ncbi:MAG: two-component regulator propeller domain-containing protein, partial [Bacteroidales bacterium]